MRRAAFVFCLVAAIACKKERAVPPPEARDDDAGISEGLALCREHYPCPLPKGYCATEARDKGAVPYSAPGIRIVHNECAVHNGELDDFVGITATEHLRGMALLARIQGTPEERARAAKDLVLDGLFSELDPRCPVREGDGWVFFCARDSDRKSVMCRTLVDGSVSCGPNAGAHAFQACRQKSGKQRLFADEYLDEKTRPIAASFMNKQPSNHALSTSAEQIDSVMLTAKGLTIHEALCVIEDFPYDSMYATWGEDPSGRILMGAELAPRLDTLEGRIAIASEAIREQHSTSFLITDATGNAGAPPGADLACALPPGPREANGEVVFYIAQGVRLDRCRVSTTTYHGDCTEVVPRSQFCIWR